MRIGILSDIHGDVASFEKALRLFTKLGVTTIVCAGDVVEKGPNDDGVVDILRGSRIQAVQGNHDANAVRHFALSEAQKIDGETPLKSLTIEQLRELPASLELQFGDMTMLLTHAIPSHNAGRVFHEKGVERLSKRFKKDLARTNPELVVVGHTHFPFDVQFKGKRIVNPGATCSLKYRDSHTVGVLDSTSSEFNVYGIENEAKSDILRGEVN